MIVSLIIGVVLGTEWPMWGFAFFLFLGQGLRFLNDRKKLTSKSPE